MKMFIFKKILKNNLSAFTLLEILIVMGIVGTLTTVGVILLQPAEHLNSSRDIQRMTDLENLNKTLGFYLFDVNSPNQNFGSSSVAYLSLPDTNPNCSSYYSFLPGLPGGWSYSCQPELTYRNINGTGWLPVDFSLLSTNSPLSILPIDPENDKNNDNNQNNNGFYYIYTVDNDNNYKISAKLKSESKKQLAEKDGGTDNERYEVGRNLSSGVIISQSGLVYNLLNNQILTTGMNIVYAQSAPTLGQISIFNDATHIYGTSNLFWDNTNGRLGINNSFPPSYTLDVNGTLKVSATSTFSGNVGIGTATPTQKLDVNGTVKATAFQGDGSQITGIQGVPTGFVGFFNLSACPSGWSELISARGRYLVGLPFRGTLAGTDGTALSNLEDRPVGQHSHNVSDPGHSHNISDPGHFHYIRHEERSFVLGAGNSASTIRQAYWDYGCCLPRDWSETGARTNNSTTNISINNSSANILVANSGSVSGTNAPYIQFLACQKN